MPANCVSVRRTKGGAKRGVHLQREPRFVLLGGGPARRRHWRRVLLALCAGAHLSGRSLMRGGCWGKAGGSSSLSRQSPETNEADSGERERGVAIKIKMVAAGAGCERRVLRAQTSACKREHAGQLQNKTIESPTRGSDRGNQHGHHHDQRQQHTCTSRATSASVFTSDGVGTARALSDGSRCCSTL